MAKLIYAAITSLDGYIEDEAGGFDWDWMQLWRAADKVVYCRSLAAVSSARSRIERDFDPGAIQSMKAVAKRDISIGGYVRIVERC